MTVTDTIYALSSGAGRSGVAVIRISGPAAASLLAGFIGELPAPRDFALRSIRDPSSGEALDKAIVVWLPAPRSFTGEDCAELHLHGSPAVVSAVLAALGSFHGVRPAEAGEFSRRAFLNGKMDLVEVEGLADLLEARTANQRRQAFRQMSGLASDIFEHWRRQLLLIRADIEAVVDFVDEPGVAEEAAAGIDGRISALLAEISSAVEASAVAEVVRDGVQVVLSGRPNTGKSSLLNTMARRDAAIVSDVPGTTRDSIEVLLDIDGVPVVLTDTAGLRSRASDEVEEEGIRRTLLRMSEADIVVWVWSPDVEGSACPIEQAPDIVVRNKCDLNPGLFRNELPNAGLSISTRTGEGIPVFIDHLSGLLKRRYGTVESSLLVSARQVSAARSSIRLLNNAFKTPSGHLELKAEEIRLASEEIGRLTGKICVEEWLGAIFSRFCIGK
ncbi:tRNA uridine-5-carboxymethylaminomethyl(34) synthesis GTPase MnmE [Aestuariivirga sp.]|uniref:tRNA uridine-5-carboxymethylaminomethyl(34) synthesis GTPase MnmE n=1 Tax=Aestuariivirga sp. TaxID=2650926 RepID=UPI0025B98692|nr:tRNA uridine-5-carboxymethylaminomethyl(34) synthesis GTPase MnmE [Aestuariivirga sp.]MCA3554310.1 tRNA uridine-5-carboxymethylaminomethyl(34) synthesis GTPase MnmE [Aestuariivirga sp.]